MDKHTCVAPRKQMLKGRKNVSFVSLYGIKNVILQSKYGRKNVLI